MFTHTFEARGKISASLIGNSRRSGKAPWNKGGNHLAESRNPAWKGEAASYEAKHNWARRKFGSATKCEIDPSHTAFRFHWANRSHTYERRREDWIQLCPKCHWKFDHPNGLTLKDSTKSKIASGLKRAYATGRR